MSSRFLRWRKPRKDSPPSPAGLLADWGRAALFGPGGREGESAREAQARWEDATRDVGDETLRESLRRDVDEFEGVLARAVELLWSVESILAAEEDPDSVKEALGILDEAVFLSEAAVAHPCRERLGDEFRERALDLLLRVGVGEVPGGLRFAPLNRWRRERLESVREGEAYLFPWYEQWSELPEDVLDEIAAKWDVLASGDLESLGLDAGTTAVLLSELADDEGLLELSRRRAELERLLPEALRRSYAPRLERLARARLSEEASSFDEASVRAFLEGGASSEEELLERIFPAALLLPGLDDETRTEAFSRAESFLDGFEGRMGGAPEGLRPLVSWSRGEIDDDGLAREASAFWESRLREEASRRKTLDETLRDLMRSLPRRPDPSGVLAAVKERWARLVESLEPRLPLRGGTPGPAFAGASVAGVYWIGDAGIGRLAPKLRDKLDKAKKKRLPRFIELSRGSFKGGLDILAWLKEGKLDRLRARLRKFARIHTAGVAWTQDGGLIPIPPTSCEPTEIRARFHEDVVALWLLVGSRREAVEDAFHSLESWIGSPSGQPPPASLPAGVLVLGCTLEGGDEPRRLA